MDELNGGLSSEALAQNAKAAAELEHDFQQHVAADMAASKAVSRKKRGERVIRLPVALVADVCRLTTGRNALIVAELLWRRTFVCKNQTVTLPSFELAEFGISRPEKHKALAQLALAGVIRLERNVAGRTAQITMLWQPRPVAVV